MNVLVPGLCFIEVECTILLYNFLIALCILRLYDSRDESAIPKDIKTCTTKRNRYSSNIFVRSMLNTIFIMKCYVRIGLTPRIFIPHFYKLLSEV